MSLGYHLKNLIRIHIFHFENCHSFPEYLFQFLPFEIVSPNNFYQEKYYLLWNVYS